MKSLTKLVGCFLMLAGAVGAQDRPVEPTVFVLNDGAAPQYNYDRNTFAQASRQAGNEVAALVLASESEALDKAKTAAEESGADIVYLSVTNLPAENSKQLKPDFEALSRQIDAKPSEEGWKEVAFAPMCRLYLAAPAGPDEITPAMLAMMDEPNAKLNCYRLTMAYFAEVPDEAGARIMPVYIDSRAIAMEAVMPAIELRGAYLGLKDQRDENGRYKKRESNVYAPKEEIFLRAYLDHVGRTLGGTMDGAYQIDLSLEVRTPDGEVLKTAELYSYQNKSTLFYPLDHTYFWNNITAGIFLEDPGDYVVAFRFKDGSRPEMPPAEAAFPVVISDN